MFIGDLSNTELLQRTLDNNLQDAQIARCVLDGLRFENKAWKAVSVNYTHANTVGFSNCMLDAVLFFRSSLMKAQFHACKIMHTRFLFDTLIGTQWNTCMLQSTRVNQSTMQCVRIEKCVFDRCILRDFEAIESTVTNCVFNKCCFEITGDLGMNGFSGTQIENTLFINCRFTGNPLRGAHTESCVFAQCAGEITDDAVCENTYGLGSFSGILCGTTLEHRTEAQQFIKEWV